MLNVGIKRLHLDTADDEVCPDIIATNGNHHHHNSFERMIDTSCISDISQRVKNSQYPVIPKNFT